MKDKYWAKYFKKALIATLFLKCIPFIRMVGLNGSMVRGEFRKESDIDFLIITEKNRIFTIRFFITIIIRLLGLKRSDKKIAGRICLNRFATIQKLEITPHNKYHAWTFYNLVPLFSTKGVYENYRENNQWMSEVGFPVNNNSQVIQDSFFSLIIRKVSEKVLTGKLGNIFEYWQEKKQTQRINRKIKNDSKDWNITISKNELCFHAKVNFADYDKYISVNNERQFN